MFRRVTADQLATLVGDVEKLLPPTTAEQRAELYGDVEALLTCGFLSTPVRVRRTSVALRSLLPGDLVVLRARSQGRIDLEWKIRATAASLWMVEDRVLLENAAGHEIIGLVGSLGAQVVEDLFGIVLGMFARQLDAYETVGVFVYEQRSRELWKMLGPAPWNAAGIPGAGHLGSNWTQRWWIAFNQVEDERARMEAQWEGFKLAASAMAPQAVRKIDDRDRGIRDREFERRSRALDQHYWYRAGVLDRDGYLRGRARWAMGSRPITAPKSVDELAQEHQRWVRGELDDHDRIILMHRQAAEEQDRQQMLQAKQELEAEIQAEQEEPDALVVRTPVEVASMPQRRTTFIPDVKVAAGKAYWKRRQEQGKGYR